MPFLLTRRALLAGGTAALLLPASYAGLALQNAGAEPFARFLPSGYQPGRDDCAYALEAAAAWSAGNNRAVAIGGSHRLSRCATIRESGARLRFDDAVFAIADNGAPGRLSNGGRGQIGLLFQGADALELSGAARFVGQGAAGRTSLAGLVFDRCANVRSSARLSCETMAAGIFAMWCDDGQFGDLAAARMDGRQTFDAGTAGSALIVIGCRRTRFGAISASGVRKPALYCSVAPSADGSRTDNEGCGFGLVTSTPTADPIESSLIAIRSARDCTFAGCSGRGASKGLLITRYASDRGWAVTGNRIASVSGSFPATAASVDAAIIQEAENVSVAVGSNHVENVDVTCGGEYGLFVNSGELTAGSIAISGGGRPIGLFGGGLSADTLALRDQQLEAIRLDGGARLAARLVDVQTGSRGGSRVAILVGDAGGARGLEIETLRYRRNGVGDDLLYGVYEPAGRARAARIGRVDGGGASFGAPPR